MKIAIITVGVICLAAGFFAGKTMQQRSTIAQIKIVNASDYTVSAFQISTKGGTLNPGESHELLYGMQGESGYAMKVNFADGSVSEIPDAYISGGDKQVITIEKDKKISLQ